MFHENLVMRNLGLLNRLSEGKATLEELAQAVKCREGELSSSLRVLSEQGLVEQADDGYQLTDRESASQALSMINPWVSYFNDEFYEIAKDAARAIHEKSWEDKRVVGVMLYGSTLTKSDPSDIDLLIIHDGGFGMENYSPYGTARLDEPVSEENARYTAYSQFKHLGYKDEERIDDNVAAAIGKRIEGLDAGTISEEQIIEETKLWKYDSFDIANLLDVYGINNVFDVIVLHTGILKADANDEVEIVPGLRRLGMRKEAIESCRDPTFWHTIFSEGRIYDRAKHDFTLTVEDKYPGALSLFPSK